MRKDITDIPLRRKCCSVFQSERYIKKNCWSDLTMIPEDTDHAQKLDMEHQILSLDRKLTKMAAINVTLKHFTRQIHEVLYFTAIS